MISESLVLYKKYKYNKIFENPLWLMGVDAPIA
jgi:hypothetical protein